MREERREVELFESRRRDLDRSSHCAFEKEREFRAFDRRKKKEIDFNESRILRQCRRHYCDNSIKI